MKEGGLEGGVHWFFAYCMAWKANVFHVLARSVLHSNSAHDTLKQKKIPPLHKPFVSVSNGMRILPSSPVAQLV